MFNKGVRSEFRGRIGSAGPSSSSFSLFVNTEQREQESLNLIKEDKSSVNHAARRK